MAHTVHKYQIECIMYNIYNMPHKMHILFYILAKITHIYGKYHYDVMKYYRTYNLN